MGNAVNSVIVFWLFVIFAITAAVSFLTNHKWFNVAAAVAGIALAVALLITRYQ